MALRTLAPRTLQPLACAALFAGLGTACGPRLDPDVANFDVVLVGVDDSCHADPVSSKESFTYGLAFEGTGSTGRVMVYDDLGGYNTFATGRIVGCQVLYASPVYRETRGEGAENWIQWELEGEATWQPGGSGCDVEGEAQDLLTEIPNPDWDSLQLGYEPSELDWVGLETFSVVGVGDAVDEEVEVGCYYQLLVGGVFLDVDG